MAQSAAACPCRPSARRPRRASRALPSSACRASRSTYVAHTHPGVSAHPPPARRRAQVVCARRALGHRRADGAASVGRHDGARLAAARAGGRACALHVFARVPERGVVGGQPVDLLRRDDAAARGRSAAGQEQPRVYVRRDQLGQDVHCPGQSAARRGRHPAACDRCHLQLDRRPGVHQGGTFRG